MFTLETFCPDLDGRSKQECCKNADAKTASAIDLIDFSAGFTLGLFPIGTVAIGRANGEEVFLNFLNAHADAGVLNAENCGIGIEGNCDMGQVSPIVVLLVKCHPRAASIHCVLHQFTDSKGRFVAVQWCNQQLGQRVIELEAELFWHELERLYLFFVSNGCDDSPKT